jgi:hypothetical protein
MDSPVESAQGNALALHEEPLCALAIKHLCAALGAESQHGMDSPVESAQGNALALKEEPQCALACQELCAALGAEGQHGMEKLVKSVQGDAPALRVALPVARFVSRLVVESPHGKTKKASSAAGVVGRTSKLRTRRGRSVYVERLHGMESQVGRAKGVVMEGPALPMTVGNVSNSKSSQLNAQKSKGGASATMHSTAMLLQLSHGTIPVTLIFGRKWLWPMGGRKQFLTATRNLQEVSWTLMQTQVKSFQIQWRTSIGRTLLQERTPSKLISTVIGVMMA